MATNENEVGLVAKFDINVFEQNSKKFNDLVKKNNKIIEEVEKRRAKEAKELENLEKERLAVAEKAKREEENMNRQRARSFTQAFALISAAVVGIVATYKKLEEEAVKLGDTQTIAEFKAIDESAQGFADTLSVMALELNKVAGILPFFTGIFETARQLIALATGELVYMVSFISRIPEILKSATGLDWADKLREKLQEVGRDARKLSEASFIQIAVAPERAKNVERGVEQEKELKKRFDAQEQYAEKFRDLQIKTGQSLLDAEKDYQDKSASAWKDYIEKAADIVANGVKERAKIQSDYQKKISDAEREYQRGVEDLNSSHGQRLVDIEADYQKRIRDIQGTYEEDAMDAIRNLDAIALLRAQERRDKDLQSARVGRDEQIAQEETDYQRSLYELQRALQDKRREAEDDRRTELEEQRRSEQEKLNEAKAAYNEQAAEAQRAFNEKISAIRSQYQQEDIEAQAHYLNQESQLRNHMLAMQAIMAQYGLVGGGAVTSPTRSPRGGGRRADGGVDVVTQPTQFTAGEAGPELAIFAPLDRALPSPIMQTINHTGDFSHSIDASITSAVAGIDGRIQAAVRRALDEVIR